jgi:hypothetical protein
MAAMASMVNFATDPADMVFKTRVLRPFLYHQGLRPFQHSAELPRYELHKPTNPAMDATVGSPGIRPFALCGLAAPSQQLPARRQEAFSQRRPGVSPLVAHGPVGLEPISPRTRASGRSALSTPDLGRWRNAETARQAVRLRLNGVRQCTGQSRRRLLKATPPPTAPWDDALCSSRESLFGTEGDPSFMNFSEEPDDFRVRLPAHRIGDSLPETPPPAAHVALSRGRSDASSSRTKCLRTRNKHSGSAPSLASLNLAGHRCKLALPKGSPQHSGLAGLAGLAGFRMPGGDILGDVASNSDEFGMLPQSPMISRLDEDVVANCFMCF